MTSTSGNSSTCSSSGARRHRHHKRRFATTVCAGVLALAASAILLASNDGLYTSTEGGHRQLKTSAGGKNHRASSKQEAAATGENKRRQLAKDDDYVKIGDRRLAAAGVDEKRRLLDDGLGEKQPIFRLESLIGTLFGSEEAGWAKRKLADRIVKSPRTFTEETGNNRYNPLRKLSLYLLGNGCLITPAQALPRERQIETSVVASYPGSGAVSFTLSFCFPSNKFVVHICTLKIYSKGVFWHLTSPLSFDVFVIFSSPFPFSENDLEAD